MPGLSGEERVVVIILVALGLAIGALLWWQGRTEGSLAWEVPGEAAAGQGPAEAAVAAGETGWESGSPASQVEGAATPAPEAALVVHVAGAVLQPGVYSLPPGSRVIDAVNAAGGVGTKADVDMVNLARTLVDGEQVYIPTREQTRGGGAAATGRAGTGAGAAAVGVVPTGKVNLNTATQVQLEALPGIGPALAARIIEHRTLNGPFLAPEELLGVSGIGEKKFAEIKDLVTAP